MIQPPRKPTSVPAAAKTSDSDFMALPRAVERRQPRIITASFGTSPPGAGRDRAPQRAARGRWRRSLDDAHLANAGRRSRRAASPIAPHRDRARRRPETRRLIARRTRASPARIAGRETRSRARGARSTARTASLPAASTASVAPKCMPAMPMRGGVHVVARLQPRQRCLHVEQHRLQRPVTAFDAPCPRRSSARTPKPAPSALRPPASQSWWRARQRVDQQHRRRRRWRRRPRGAERHPVGGTERTARRGEQRPSDTASQRRRRARRASSGDSCGGRSRRAPSRYSRTVGASPTKIARLISA